jgi:glycogen phosphorylase
MPKTAPRARRSTKSASSSPVQRWDEVHVRLDALARNLWWTWNPQARRVLESMHPATFRATNHNPVATLARLDEARREALAGDGDFLANLETAERGLEEYLSAKSWYARTYGKGKAKNALFAYFCMEYGLHECLPLYAGGLGILAADHLKSASDLGVPLVAVGILWRYGYYRQELRADGTTRVATPRSNFEELPVDDTGKEITVQIGASKVRAKIWCLTVGRVPLYLLDTDLPENAPSDRLLSHNLYKGGDPDLRVRQEILLGIGGLLALEALGLSPTVFHLNEGHAAFCPLERLRRLVVGGTPLDKAIDKVRAQSVFTTHTPVPEGNDRFDAALVMKYLGHMPDDLGLGAHDFLSLGREDPDNEKEQFCMTVLALLLSERCNGVAELHGDTSRRMWMKTYDAEIPDEVPIGHVTNGIHPESWIADEARPFYDKYFKPTWVGAGPEDDWWKNAHKIPPAELWNLRQTLRKKMVAELRIRLREELVARQQAGDDVEHLIALYETFDEGALTIGFARRFATYKRAPLIFKDAKRLAKIMGDSDRPVQLIFAGKAHPQDMGGQEFVKQVYEFTKKPPFRGRVFLVQNYDTNVGRLLTSGCDVWLNNPVRPMEASGTSGMKPPLNGGLNCSILDGWWPEGYNKKNGWALGGEQFPGNRKKQDDYDAKAIYETLEGQVVPLFYSRDKGGVPQKWVKMMAESMRSICAQFSTHRMVAEYVKDYYLG